MSLKLVKSNEYKNERDKFLDFFKEFGFVVIREVFNSDICVKTRSAMWFVNQRNIQVSLYKLMQEYYGETITWIRQKRSHILAEYEDYWWIVQLYINVFG